MSISDFNSEVEWQQTFYPLTADRFDVERTVGDTFSSSFWQKLDEI